MKLNPKHSQAGISIWDLFIILLVFIVLFLVYARGFVDEYLPDHLRSAVVLAQPTPEAAPEAPKTELERLREAQAAQANRPRIEAVPGTEAVAEAVRSTTAENATATGKSTLPSASRPMPGASTPTMPTDLTQLDRRFWPRTVLLTKATEFPVVFNGRVAGKALVPVGAEVELVQIEPNAVTVKNREAVMKLPLEDTDLRSRAKANFDKLHR